MADTLESLEIEVKHSASGAADEIKQVASAVRSLGRALGKVLPNLSVFQKTLGKNTFNFSSNSNRTTQIADTINNVNQAAAKAQKATREAGRGIREMSKEAAKSKSPLDNLISSLKRIAFYRVIRSIIKAIGQAFQEGLQNAYAFSAGISTEGHRFSAALDSMSSAGLKMKNQLGSAFIGLLAAIAPIVNAIIGFITKIADALSQLFAIFTGGTYLKAADVPAKWADAAGGAAKAAKEWKNQLLAFDEINRLEEPSDPSGGGGGAGALDPSQMFVDTPIDGIFAKIRDELIKFRDSLDFEPLKRAWGELVDVAGRFADMVERRVGYVWETYLKPLAKWTIEVGLPLLIEDLAKAFGLVLDVLEDLEPYLESFDKNFIIPLRDWDFSRVENGLKGLGDLIDRIDGLVKGNTSVKDFFDGINVSINDVINWINPFHAIIEEISNWISQKLSELVRGIKQQLQFSKQAFKETWEGIKQDLFNLLVEGIRQALNKILELWNRFRLPEFHIPTPHFEWTYTQADGVIAEALRFVGLPATIPHLNISWYAKGGFPDEGSLYFAGERGPELVGSMGNRNAVANNDQIVEGIRQGVYEAVSAAMSSASTGEPVVKVYLDSREIKNGQNRLNRAMGVG